MQQAGVRLWAGACKSELPPWTEGGGGQFCGDQLVTGQAEGPTLGTGS